MIHWMRIGEVADRAGMHSQTVHRHVVDGRLPAYRIASELRFNAADVDAWITRREVDRLERATLARELIAEGRTRGEVAALFGVSRSTVDRWRRHDKVRRHP